MGKYFLMLGALFVSFNNYANADWNDDFGGQIIDSADYVCRDEKGGMVVRRPTEKLIGMMWSVGGTEEEPAVPTIGMPIPMTSFKEGTCKDCLSFVAIRKFEEFEDDESSDLRFDVEILSAVATVYVGDNLNEKNFLGKYSCKEYSSK